MNLYHWNSRLLKNYSTGDIIVMAETVEQAQNKVYSQFKPLEDDNPFVDYYLQMLHMSEDPDYESERLEKLMILTHDLDVEPTVIASGVVCIRGSD